MPVLFFKRLLVASCVSMFVSLSFIVFPHPTFAQEKVVTVRAGQAPDPCTTTVPQGGSFYHVEAVQSFAASPVDAMGGLLYQAEISVPAQPLNWSITQILAESANGRDSLEIGWAVEPAPTPNGYGDTNLHLFIFTRHQGGFCNIHKDSSGWRGNFHPVVSSPLPGASLAKDGKTHEFIVLHSNGAWWIGYETGWIGYIDDVQWENQFTQVAQADWYGEVHSDSQDYPCSSMGNGLFGHQGNSAVIDRMFFVRNGKFGLAGASLLSPENSSYYDSDKTPQSSPFNSFRYGGPGSSCGPLVTLLTPHSGPSGTSITVTGSNWEANDQICIFWDTVPNVALTCTTSGQDGTFTTSFRVPSGTSKGTHLVYVDNMYHSTQQTTLSFNVT